MKKEKKKKKKQRSKNFFMFFNLFFLNQTQHPRTQTHHKNTKEKKTNYHLSLFIDELEFSHSFPTRTTLLVSRPKQHDHSKSRSTLTVSRPKQHDPQDKLQQNRARPKQNDRFEEERRCKIHPCPPKPQATTPKSP